MHKMDETGVFLRFASQRIWNDREMDAGILQLAMGIWIVAFHLPQGVLMWWGQLYRFMSPTVWGLAFGMLGLARIIWAITRRAVPLAALFSGALFFAFAFDIWYTQWRWLGLPVFLWHGYQSIKSYLRLALIRRGR